MRSTTATVPQRGSTGRRTWHLALIAVLLAGAFSFAVAALTPTTAQAAPLTIDQCNGHGPAAEGATTGMKCTVTVVNTLSGTTTSSTTTVTRLCTLGPCSSPNGTFTTSSSSLVTNVTQCNGSDNDSAHPINCDVTITNNISTGTPGAEPVTAATVNQCVGSAAGGGGIVNCNPFPATTTGATVTQCNGSGNGGGGTVDCAVGTESKVSPAIPVTVNQCNGTGNPGGTVVTCRANLITNLTAAAASPTATATATGTATGTPSPAATATASPTSTNPAQVTRVPTGGVPAGSGTDAGAPDVRLLALGGSLFLAAAISVLLRRRLAQGAGLFRR